MHGEHMKQEYQPIVTPATIPPV